MSDSRQGIIYHPEYINSVATIIGMLRNIANAEMNEEHSRFKRGSLSEQVNILGVRCELIVQHHLYTNHVIFESAMLLRDKPVYTCDLTIFKSKRRIDVKGTRTDATDLLVNKESHFKKTEIIDYLFIQPISKNAAKYWFFSRDEVSRWGIKDCNYSDAFFKPIKDLPQINPINHEGPPAQTPA